jgi:hypothetical protein
MTGMCTDQRCVALCETAESGNFVIECSPNRDVDDGVGTSRDYRVSDRSSAGFFFALHVITRRWPCMCHARQPAAVNAPLPSARKLNGKPLAAYVLGDLVTLHVTFELK